MGYRQGNNGSFAEFKINEAWLSGTFGENYARKVFGSEAVNSLPRYSRGPRKGQLKGKITWRKVTKGGWVSGHGIVPLNLTYGHGLWLYPYNQDPELVAGVDTYDRDAAKSTLGPDDSIKEENTGSEVDPNHPVYQYAVANGYQWSEVIANPKLLEGLITKLMTEKPISREL